MNLAVNLKCIQMRSGVEIWAEASRVNALQQKLVNMDKHFFVEYEGQTINTADIVGIFTADTMDSHTRRKNSQWQCSEGKWHGRGEKCECLPRQQSEMLAQRRKAYMDCGRCDMGYVKTANNSVTLCECQIPLREKR